MYHQVNIIGTFHQILNRAGPFVQEYPKYKTCMSQVHKDVPIRILLPCILHFLLRFLFFVKDNMKLFWNIYHSFLLLME